MYAYRAAELTTYQANLNCFVHEFDKAETDIFWAHRILSSEVQVAPRKESHQQSNDSEGISGFVEYILFLYI